MAPSTRNMSLDSDQNDGDKKEVSEMVETVSPLATEVKESAWASAKKNPKVILYSVAACVSSMLWGFDIGTYKSPTARSSMSSLTLTYSTRS